MLARCGRVGAEGPFLKCQLKWTEIVDLFQVRNVCLAMLVFISPHCEMLREALQGWKATLLSNPCLSCCNLDCLSCEVPVGFSCAEGQL